MKMKQKWSGGWLALFALVFVAVGLMSVAANGDNASRTKLEGFQEVAAVSSTGSGKLRLRLHDTSLDFELSYSGLEGDITQSHLHLGQKGVNGGIVIFLCTNLGNAPAGTNTPTCPGPKAGSVSGTRTAGDVVPVVAQGIAALEFEEVLKGIRSGNVYANVHSTKHGPGEIRGQIRKHNHDHDDDDD